MIKWKNLQRLQADWGTIDTRAIERRREILARAPFMDQWLFTNAVRTARTSRGRLVTDFAYGYADALYMDASVAATPHMDRLLELAMKPTRGGADTQRWFEAMSLFDQALAVARIEKSEPAETIGRVLEGLVDLLEQNIFTKGFEAVDVFAYHNPKQDFTVEKGNVRLGKHLSRPGLSRRKSRMTCRVTDDGELVYMHYRLKDAFRTWLKTQRYIAEGKQKNPYHVTDRCGLMFVVETEEQAIALGQRMLMVLEANGARVKEPLSTNFDVDSPLDEFNAASSSDYRLAKAYIRFQRVVIELQFMTFHGYLTSQRSLSDANHELYKVRQANKYFFPLIWPTRLYGIDWKNPHVRHQMLSWKQAQLGWRVTNGDSSDA